MSVIEREVAPISLEAMREALLEKLKDIPEYDPEKGSQIDQAFEELKHPVDDPQLSCLRIAKAYLSLKEETSPNEIKKEEDKERKEQLEKAILIRWLLMSALETTNIKDFFENYADELNSYFRALVKVETTSELEDKKRKDIILGSMQQGEILKELDDTQSEALKRIKENKPLVFLMVDTGYGDMLLMAAAVADTAKTLEMIGSKSNIRYLVKPEMAELISAMLQNYPNIEVVPTYATNPDPLYLARLAIDNKPHIQFDENGNPFVPNYEQDAGIILVNDQRPQRPVNKEDFPKGTLYLGAHRPLGLPLTQNINSSYTFRHTMQVKLSYRLGLKIFNTARRNDISEFSEGIEKYINEYLESGKGEYIRNILDQLKRRPGFDNGFISIVSHGSNGSKRITPSVADYISQELSNFCKENNIGVVLLRTDNHKKPVDKESDQIEEHIEKYDIPIYQFFITPQIIDTLVLLKDSCGIMGPDTMLMHIAEFFKDKPVLDIHASTHKLLWRIDDRVITAQHIIAYQGELNLIQTRALSEIMSLYEQIIHPLTVLTKDEKSNYHPLIQTVQDNIGNKIKNGIEEFKNIAKYSCVSDQTFGGY